MAYLNFLFSLIRDFVSNSLIVIHNELKLTCDVNPQIMYDNPYYPTIPSLLCIRDRTLSTKPQVGVVSDDAHILFTLLVMSCLWFCSTSSILMSLDMGRSTGGKNICIFCLQFYINFDEVQFTHGLVSKLSDTAPV